MAKPKKHPTTPKQSIPQPQPKYNGNANSLLGKLPLAVFILYIIAVLYGVTVHEPWRDEAQAWLLVRDLDIAGLFRILPSEGHPPLWYLLIMPLAKMGAAYQSQNYLAAITMIATMYVFLFKTRLPLVVKLILPFSYFFFYEYAVLARSYCLVAFFTSLIIWLYPRRFNKPMLFALCIVGLFNTHILTFTFALALAGIFFIDAWQTGKLKQTFPAFLLMLIGGLYLIPYLAMAKMASASQIQAVQHAAKMADAVAGSLLVDGNTILAFVLLLIIAIIMLYRTKPFLIFAAGVAGILYILGFRYNLGDVRHFGILFTVIIGSYAIADNYVSDKWNFVAESKLPTYGKWIIVAVVVLQLPQTFSRYKDDVKQDFSGAKAAAEFIMDNNLQQSILAGQQAWAVSAIVPYLHGKQVYYAECQRYGTYYIYDSCFLNNRWAIAPEDAVDVVYNNFKDSLGNVVFIFNRPLNPGALKYMDMLYSSGEFPIKKDEAFFIYRFKPVIKQ